MIKVVINRCYGGFGLSEKALSMYNKISGKDVKYAGDIERDCPFLVTIVETMGGEVNTRFSDLKVVEIPDGTKWYVGEYDGIEWVAEGATWE